MRTSSMFHSRLILPCFELYSLAPQRTTYVRRLGGIVRKWRCYFEHKTKRQYFIAFGSVWSWICPKIIVWFRKTPTQSPQNWSLKMKKKHQKCLDETILWCSDICPYVDSELLLSLFVSTLRLLIYYPNSPSVYIEIWGTVQFFVFQINNASDRLYATVNANIIGHTLETAMLDAVAK